MATIYEGDAVRLFNSNLGGYVRLYPTSFSKCQVIIRSNNLSCSRYDHFSLFQFLPEKSSKFDHISPLSKLKCDRYELMYGQKIKLRHVASRLFLSAVNDNTLELTKSGEDYSTLFKIVSQMKTQGESVCSGDNVKLESVIKKGFYVLCFLDKPVNRFQLEMATISSDYKLECVPDISMSTTLDIMDGNIVWIQSVEINGLVVGSDKFFSQVAFKQKTNGMELECKQPVSCNSWWQIEAVDHVSGYGRLILPTVKVYIKHIVSEKYLKINKEDTTVELLPFDESKKEEFHFYLVYYDQTKEEPIMSGNKITIMYDDREEIRMFLSIIPQPNSQKCSNGYTWHHLRLVDEDSYDQHCCFKIDKVKPEYIHAVYIVLGIKSFLQDEIQKCDQKYFDKKQISSILTELNQLTKEGDSNYLVKTLKSCMVLDLMIELLCKSIESVHLCNEISEVLLSIVQSASPSTRKYLGQKCFIIFYEQFYSEKGFEKVFIELIRNESSVGKLMFEKLKSEIAQNRGFYTTLLNNKPFADLLIALCQSGGKEIRDVICQDIIEKQTLYQLETFVMENGREGVLFVKPDVMKGPIGRYCSIGSKCEMECNFLIAQLKLFSQLCKGVNNENCIGIIKRHVSFKQAVLVLKDETIHPLVQAAYLEVVTAAYIDKGVQNLCYCFLWEDLDSLKRYNAKKVFPNNKVHNDDIVNVRKIDFTVDEVDDTDVVCFFATIKKMLRNNEELDTEEHYKNELLCQMLVAIETILENGYFWNISKNSDLDLDVLVNMLNGGTDKYPEGVNRFRKKFHKTFFQVKIRLIKLLHIYFKKLSFLALRNFLCMFKDSYDHNVTEPDFLLINNADVSDMLKNKRLSNKQIRAKTNSIQKCFEFCHYSCFNSGAEKLTKVLIDLMYYDDEELKLSSAVLLFDIHQKERILFDQVQTNCYLHNPTSKDMYNMMIKEGSCDESSNLKKLLEGTLVEDDVFKDLQKFFIVESTVQVNTSAQNVAYFSGVFKVIMKFVLDNCNKDESPVIETHLTNACKTLEIICCENDMVKREIFTHTEELLKATKSVSSVANLLTKVFKNNSQLCQCLSEHDIQQMYSLANNLELSREYLKFYCTLEIIMKPRQMSVIKDNQNIIAMLFYKNRGVHKLMNRDEIQKIIKMLVEYKKNPEENIKVLRILCICNMLATACEGKCRFAEDICQDIFTLDDLIRIICSKDILLEHKTPFVRLLTEAYVATERPCHQIISQIMSEVYICLWDHINECVTSFEDCIAEYSILQFKTYFENCHIWSGLLLEGKETTFRTEFVYMAYGLVPLITSVFQVLWQLEISPVCILKFDKALVCAQSCRNLLLNKGDYDSLMSHPVKPHTTISASKTFRSKATPDDEVHINEKLQFFVRNYKTVYKWTPGRSEMEKDLDDLTGIETKAEYHQNLAVTIFKKFQKKLGTCEINIVDVHWDVFIQVFSALNKQCWCQVSSQQQFTHSLTILQILFHYTSISDDSQCHEQCLAKALLLLQNSNDYYAVQIMAYLCVLLTNDKCDIQKSIMKFPEELISLLDRMVKLIKLATPSPTYHIRLDKSSKEYEDIDSSIAIVKIVVDEVETLSTSSEASSQGDDKKSSNNQQDLIDEKHSTFSLPSNQLKPCLANSTEQVRVVLKLIAKLCDGQQRDMQNLLRYQEHSTTEQINIVGAITVLFQTSTLSSETILLTKDGIQALIEMCSGNHKNQIEVINNQVLDFINNVLEYSTDCDVDKSEDKKAEILAMKCKVIELLEVLLEETDKEHKQICGIIARDLHKSKLKKLTEKELYKQSCKDKDVHRALFRAYHVLKKLDQVDKSDDEVWSYVSSKTQSIKLNYKVKRENQVLSHVCFHFKETL